MNKNTNCLASGKFLLMIHAMVFIFFLYLKKNAEAFKMYIHPIVCLWAPFFNYYSDININDSDLINYTIFF